MFLVLQNRFQSSLKVRNLLPQKPPPSNHSTTSLDRRYSISFVITLFFLSEYSFTALHTKARFIRPNNISLLVFDQIDVFIHPAKPNFAVSCVQFRLVSCSVRFKVESIDIRSKSFYTNKSIQFC